MRCWNIKKGANDTYLRYHVRPSMFESLMSEAAALSRHRTSPLRQGREDFLRYLNTCGTSKANVRVTACYLLQIIRLLRLRKPRDVTPVEVDQATQRWARRKRAFNDIRPGRHSAARFGWEARRWMRFAGRLRTPRAHQPFGRLLGEFVQAMKVEQGLAEATIKGRGSRTADFLKWYAKRHRTFREVSVENLDAYLLRKGPTRNLVTIGCEAAALRAFFRWAEERRFCLRGLQRRSSLLSFDATLASIADRPGMMSSGFSTEPWARMLQTFAHRPFFNYLRSTAFAPVRPSV